MKYKKTHTKIIFALKKELEYQKNLTKKYVLWSIFLGIATYFITWLICLISK